MPVQNFVIQENNTNTWFYPLKVCTFFQSFLYVSDFLLVRDAAFLFKLCSPNGVLVSFF